LIEGFSIDGSFEVENDRDIYDIRAVTTTGGLLRVDVLSDDAADDDTWFALRDIDGALLFATTAKTTRSRPHAPTDRRDTLYLDLGAHPDAVFLDAWSRHGVGGYYTAHLTAAREEQRCRDARDCVAGNACLEMHDPAATPTTWTECRAPTEDVCRESPFFRPAATFSNPCLPGMTCAADVDSNEAVCIGNRCVEDDDCPAESRCLDTFDVELEATPWRECRVVHFAGESCLQDYDGYHTENPCAEGLVCTVDYVDSDSAFSDCLWP
jgi:hypothetical protein